MHIIEQGFCRIEYEKFALREMEQIPLDREHELQELIQKHGERSQRRQHYKRLALLKSEAGSAGSRSYYAQAYGIAGVRQYVTSSGHTVYTIPVLSFQMSPFRSHDTNCHLVLGKDLTLIDCGTGDSEPSLEEGFRVVRDFFGEKVAVEDIRNVIVTHAHIDHFGGLTFLYPRCKPDVYAHEDDAQSIRNVQDVLSQTSETIARFLSVAGIEPAELRELREMYTKSKRTAEGIPVTHPVRDSDRVIENFEIIHVPGHCPGQINIRIGDIAFLGDHILMDITPHQFPRFYMKGMGLVHYIPSLLKISSRSQKIRLGLAGHNEAVQDVRGRAMEIIDLHHNRLADILSLMDRPKTLYELTTQYFTEIEGKPLAGYDRILALEEIQAHMEYLDGAMNYIEVVREKAGGGEVLRYRRR
jgi:glyoxylase-like metal-dependent hydrolase (beta-lactamase superfamily II)